MKEKIEIIKQIVKFHPSYGQDKGWSTYTGGMADTGSWYWEKMVDETEASLSNFLDYLLIQKAKNESIQNSEDELQKEMGKDAYYKYCMDRHNEVVKEIIREEEMYLMWGKDYKTT